MSSAIALAIALMACKGSSSSKQAPPVPDDSAAPAPDAAAASAESPPADAVVAMPAPPAEFAAFEAVLKPVLAEVNDDARGRKACAAHGALRQRAADLRKLAAPSGVDVADWTAYTEDLSSAIGELKVRCSEDEPDSAGAYAKQVGKSYDELVALIAKASGAK